MNGNAQKLIKYLDGASKRFIIPVYQRNYDWKMEHCKQLYDDLVKIIRQNRKSHFFGSIVSVQSESGTMEEFLIIDGQQRLTTISLLLLAIYHLLSSGKMVSRDHQLTDKILKKYLIDEYEPEEKRIKLKPIKNDQKAFGILFDQDEEYIPDSNLTINYRFIGEIHMKYVAFLDILGFKNKLAQIPQHEAKNFIGDFSSTVYSVFRQQPENINGFIVSDSIVLSTNDVMQESLIALVNTVQIICREEFSQNGILIRGAIAKGEFDDMPAKELSNLQKRLIVGQAYVDAYLLENSTKMIGINLSEAVYCDLRNCDICFDVMSEKIEKNDHYILRYITIDYLLDENNIRQFVKLASEANWLPHYYNALYFALKKEKNDKKVEQVFMNITHLVCDEKPSENWRLLDVFIKNSFQEDVLDDYQTRFLKHIRRHLI